MNTFSLLPTTPGKAPISAPTLAATDGDARFRALFARRPVVLAPMEDVSDAAFRRLCRARGAELCVTEFVHVERLLGGCRRAQRKIQLSPDDRPTAIQIYGADAARLSEAAAAAEAAEPTFIDINCGCWVPRIARKGTGAAWLRDPGAMVAMAAMVVKATKLPVTVKTRVAWDAASSPPIVELARRLEGVGVRALTIHCRTATMGLTGEADWSWAARARAVVSIPILVNGNVRSAEDARRAIEQTGCEGVMIGTRAIEHPWIFRECRALLDHGIVLPPPSVQERLSLYREHLAANIARRGEQPGVHCTRRHLPGYLHGLPDAEDLRRSLNATDTHEGCLAVLERRRAS